MTDDKAAPPGPEPGPERLPALGEPVPEDNHDFAEEHDQTAVSEDLTAGTDQERESESPKGLGGMDMPGPV